MLTAGHAARRRISTLAALGAVACMVAAGCEGDPDPAPPREFSALQLQEVRPAGDGLDVEFWVTDLSPVALGRALAPISSYRSQGSRSRLWEGNGLRVYVVPADQARSVVGALPLQGQARRESLPMLGRWRPLSGGRRWDSGLDIWLDQQDWGLDPGAMVAISSGRLTLGGGTLRLLARSWLVAGTPVLGGAEDSARVPAAMVLQLLPQHVDAARSADLLAGPALNAATDQGQTFERLLVDLICDPGQTVLIVPAHPREEWPQASEIASRPVPAAPAASDAPEVKPREIDDAPAVDPVPLAAPAAADARNQDQTADSTAGPAAGPALPDLLTLGEAMLTDAIVGRGAHRRVIISITPRIPPEFQPVPMLGHSAR
ncbi:MAG: hypothetical protein AMXMBFR58_08790 [Phycisphaerae bacterium]